MGTQTGSRHPAGTGEPDADPRALPAPLANPRRVRVGADGRPLTGTGTGSTADTRG